MHLSKCFSVLLASGQGRKCAELRNILHRTLLVRDSKDSRPRVLRHKFDKTTDPEGHKELSRLLAKRVLPVMRNVSKEFFGMDLQKPAEQKISRPFTGSVAELSGKFPVTLNPNNEKHILIFRRVLELSMAHGLWAGTVGNG